MRIFLLFNVLLCCGVYSGVECFLEKFSQVVSSVGSIFGSSTDAEYPSLVLVVLKSLHTFIANVPVVTNRMGSNFNKYLFACPAETEAEMRINQESSLTKRALFIKKFYERPTDKEKTKKKGGKTSANEDLSEFDKLESEFIEYPCESPILPSRILVGVVNEFGLDVEYHVVGYEVYMKGYENSKVAEYEKKLRLNKNFAWFNLLSIRFDRKGGNVLSVTCEMYNDRMNVRPPQTKSNLGDGIYQDLLWKNDFYKDYEITNTYSIDNQESVFKKLFKDSPLVGEYLDRVQEKQLVKVHLVPPDSFVQSVLEHGARTFGNIAPMWKIIRVNSWMRVEEYVKHLIQGVYGIFVVTGTYGTLSLSRNEVDIYLEKDLKNVRVPLAFYKIISYTKKLNEFYNILIVTINNPYKDITNVLCPKSECTDYGWEYIERDDHATGRTFCCELNPEILKKLQIIDGITLGKTLHLKKVPHWENEKLTLDLAKFIQDQKNKPTEASIRADDMEYRNDKKIKLERDLEIGRNKEEEGMGFVRIVSTIVEDYVAPFVPEVVSFYLPFLAGKKKEQGDGKMDIK